MPDLLLTTADVRLQDAARLARLRARGDASAAADAAFAAEMDGAAEGNADGAEEDPEALEKSYVADLAKELRQAEGNEDGSEGGEEESEGGEEESEEEEEAEGAPPLAAAKSMVRAMYAEGCTFRAGYPELALEYAHYVCAMPVIVAEYVVQLLQHRRLRVATRMRLSA